MKSFKFLLFFWFSLSFCVQAEIPVSPEGIPQLQLDPDAAGVLYLDFDGGILYNSVLGGAGWNSGPFDPHETKEVWGDFVIYDPEDFAENVYRIWKEVATHFAMFDLDVTTIAPDKNEKPTSQILITPSLSRGVATSNFGYRGRGGQAWANSSFASSNPILVTHELGHTLGLEHHSIVTARNVTEIEYRPPDILERMSIMGDNNGDGSMVMWSTGNHRAPRGRAFQDDVEVITQTIIAKAREFNSGEYSGDGFREDDHSHVFENATVLSFPNRVNGSGNSVRLSGKVDGVIERYDDVDLFSFQSLWV